MAYIKEVKLAAVEFARHRSIKEAARTFHISRNTVRRWVREQAATLRLPREDETERLFDNGNEIYFAEHDCCADKPAERQARPANTI